jgi:putative membrane protein
MNFTAILKTYIMMNGINHSWGMGSGYIWIIAIIIIIVAIWLIVKIMSRSDRRNALIDKSPMNILNDRYARGEISKQEYQEKRKAIS